MWARMVVIFWAFIFINLALGECLVPSNFTQGEPSQISSSVGSAPRNPAANAAEEVSARFFFKKKHKNSYNQGGYSYSASGYSWISYCPICPMNYAHACCQAGYSRCCYNRPILNPPKPGVCPPTPIPLTIPENYDATYYPRNKPLKRELAFSFGGNYNFGYSRPCNYDQECPGTEKCCNFSCTYIENSVYPISPYPVRSFG
ncbi:uncharacterized protein LOC136040641 [Artemia franciscana]